MSESNGLVPVRTLALAESGGRKPTAIIAYMASQVGPAATEAAVNTIKARFIDWRRRFSFTTFDLEEVCRKLIHPATLARIKGEWDLLAEFAKYGAPQTVVSRSRALARLQHSNRALGATQVFALPEASSPVPLGEILGKVKTEVEARQTEGGAQTQSRKVEEGRG